MKRFRKRYFKRRRNYRRKFKSSFVKKTKYAINKLAEKKTHFVVVNGGDINAQWLVTRPIAGMGQGTQKNQRVGNKVFIRYINARFRIDQNSSDTPYVRVLFVRPRTNALANGDLPGLAHVHADLQLFDILYDRMHYFGIPNTPQTGLEEKIVSKTFKIMKSVIFNDTVTNPVVNDHWLCFWSPDLIAPSPLLYAEICTTFTDV